MALDRGTLAKIDRSILSELDHGEGVHLVKVPLSDAVWSTWRRYCEAVRVSMGEGIASLIAHELGTLVNEDEHQGAVFAAELPRQLVDQVGGPRRPGTPPGRTRAVAEGVRASPTSPNKTVGCDESRERWSK